MGADAHAGVDGEGGEVGVEVLAVLVLQESDSQSISKRLVRKSGAGRGLKLMRLPLRFPFPTIFISSLSTIHTCKSLTPQGCWEPSPIGREWWTVGRRIKRVGVRRGWANLRRGVVAAVVLERVGG